MLLIGIGNGFRRDDGAGLAVAEAVRRAAPPGVEVASHHGEGTGVMALWRGRARVAVVDAAASGAAPGTLHVLDAATAEIPPQLRFFSSHAFGLAEAIAMSRALGELPAELTVYAIEGADFGAGEGLTPEVADTVHRLTESLCQPGL